MSNIGRHTALVIGAGPAGLMAAEVLSEAGVDVTIADRMPSVGRKFLMAGKSGLNLTKIEDPAVFARAYGSAPKPLRDAVSAFGPQQVVAWAEGLGQPVFTGSTGRVFPVTMKASPLLRAWLKRLENAGVVIKTRWQWKGWDGPSAVFCTPDGSQQISTDVIVLAMGGASWSRLGSDGHWAKQFDNVAPFRPANCGFKVDWTDHMAPFFGHPVKATILKAGDLTSRGEWTISKTGVEGGGIYSVASAAIDGAALIVDLVPDLTEDQVADRFAAKGGKASLSQILKSGLRLPPVKVALFHEMSRKVAKTDRLAMAKMVKALPLAYSGPAQLDKAISTTGGLTFSGLDGLKVNELSSVYAAGEMLDWDAPTGGYLLTACLATGRAAALAAIEDMNVSIPKTSESF